MPDYEWYAWLALGFWGGCFFSMIVVIVTDALARKR